MLKKFCAMIIAFCLVTTTMVQQNVSFSETATNNMTIQNRYAEALNILGIMNGSGGDLKLNNPLSRAEACVLIVKLMGKYQEAQLSKYSMKFKDVPSWAWSSVGYMNKLGIANGFSADTFAATAPASLNSYLTILLNVLGYQIGVDYKFEDVVNYSKKIGLITDAEIRNIKYETFHKYHAARLSVKALMLPMRGTTLTPFGSLYKSKQITDKQLQLLSASGWVIKTDKEGFKTLNKPEIFFEDKELERVVRLEIDRTTGVIDKNYLVSATEIFQVRSKIERLEGIENLTNLNMFSFEISQLRDISYLDKLVNMSYVNLNYSKVKDPDALIAFLNAPHLSEVTMLSRSSSMVYNPYALKNHINKDSLTVITNNKRYVMKSFELSSVSDLAKEKLKIQPYLPSAKCNYLILIENSSQLDSVMDFYKYKKSKGYNIAIQSAASIVTKAEPAYVSIRKYLLEQEKKYNLEYVLLVGNPYNPDLTSKYDTGGNIPMVYMDEGINPNVSYSGASGLYNESDDMYHSVGNHPSDSYYCYDSSVFFLKDIWNTNFKNIEMVYSLGRIPFSNPETINSVLKNTIAYTNKGKTTKTVLAGGRLVIPEKATNIGNISGEASSAMNYLDSMLSSYGFPVTTLYEVKGSLSSVVKPDKPLSEAALDTEISSSDVVFTDGHGGAVSYYWEDVNKNGISSDDYRMEQEFFNMTNGTDQIKFLFMDGCSTAQVERQENGNMSNYQSNDVISLMNSGHIIAGVGTSRDTWYDARLNKANMLYGIEAFKPGKTTGKLFSDLHADILAKRSQSEIDFYNIFDYNYFGDPSIVY